MPMSSRLRLWAHSSQVLLLRRRYCNAAAAAAADAPPAPSPAPPPEDPFTSDFGGLSRAYVKKHFAPLLNPDVQDKYRPVFTQLRAFGVDEKGFKSLVKHKHLLPTKIEEPISLDHNLDFLRRHGLAESQIAQAAAKHPPILLASVTGVLQPVIQFLYEHAVSPSGVAAMLTHCPASFTANIKSELAPRVEFLGRHGITRSHLDPCVLLHPQLLGYDLDSRLKPIIKHLEASLTPEIVRTIVVNQPHVFARSPDTISELLGALRFIGYRERPDVWSHSLGWGCAHGVEAVRDKIDFLMSHEIPYKSAVLLLRSEPHIFNVEDRVLKEKLDFFFNIMKLSINDLVRYPSYLSRKLMDRVRIRWQVLSLLRSRGIINSIFVQDLITLPNKWFVETFVFKYPDCGRVYYGARSALKQSRAQEAAAKAAFHSRF